MTKDYPRWIYYPRSAEPPEWVSPLVTIFRNNQDTLDSNVSHKKSDQALQYVRSDLEAMGFHVEGGVHESTIYRPVYFGEFGKPERQYHIDSYHPGYKIGLEVEAGRSIRGNAVYRDIVQTCLLVGVDYFALAIPQKYPFKAKGKQIVDDPYKTAVTIFDAIYSSERLKLPLKGILLIGY
jgi:hypothetical protein